MKPYNQMEDIKTIDTFINSTDFVDVCEYTEKGKRVRCVLEGSCHFNITNHSRVMDGLFVALAKLEICNFSFQSCFEGGDKTFEFFIQEEDSAGSFETPEAAALATIAKRIRSI